MASFLCILIKAVRFVLLNRINCEDNFRQLPPLRWQRSKKGYDILNVGETR